MRQRQKNPVAPANEIAVAVLHSSLGRLYDNGGSAIKVTARDGNRMEFTIGGKSYVAIVEEKP